MEKIAESNLLYAAFKGYQVIDGDVYYYENKRRLTIKKGYYWFTVRLDNKKTVSISVGQLAGYQKFGKKFLKDGIRLRYIDGNPLNNREENLAIGTAKDNRAFVDRDVVMRTVLNATSFVKKHNHEEIIKMHQVGKSYKQIMAETGIKSKGTISFIIKQSISSK